MPPADSGDQLEPRSTDTAGDPARRLGGVRDVARRGSLRGYDLVWRQMMRTEHPAWERFFARRCPHLAGMIAYFGVLSIIPAAFLFLSALALAGALENQGWIVEQLQYVIPEQGAETIVRTVEALRENSGSLGLIGFVGLVWGTSNFFSCIESALNIIYGVNNRHFIFQKAWVLFLMVAALVATTAGTIIVAVALPLLETLDDATAGTFDQLPLQGGIESTLLSSGVAFCFFLSCYRFLPNVSMSTREVWRGALIAAAGFELSIQVLPNYISENRGSFVINAFAGAFIVLIWFYLMAFVLLVGGVYNWWWREKRRIASAKQAIVASAEG